MILLLLAGIWAAVLIPPAVRARAEGRPHGSIGDFRRQLHVLARTNPQLGGSMSPYARVVASPAVTSRVHGSARGAVTRPSARSRTLKRRRDVFVGLLVVMVASLALGVLPALRVLWFVHVAADVLFVAYVAALIYLRNLAAEREMKVRFLPGTSQPAEPALLLRRSAN